MENKPKNAEEWFREGVELINLGKHLEALQAFNKAGYKNP